MRRNFKTIASLSLVALATFATAQQYTLTDLGTLSPGSYSEASGINTAGTVVGTAGLRILAARGLVPRVFAFSSGAMTLVQTKGKLRWQVRAMGINDLEQIVGTLYTLGDPIPLNRGFVYDHGTMTDLGTLGGSETQAFAINSSGQVTGNSGVAGGGVHAFLYANGTMSDLGTLGGSDSFAFAINGPGQVTGTSYLSGDSVYRAFLYSNGTMSDLGTGDSSEGLAINNAG